MPFPNEQFIYLCGRTLYLGSDVLLSRYEVIQEIAGNFDHLRQIIAIDLSLGTSRDATSEIVGTVVDRWAQDCKQLTEKELEFVAAFMGERVANAFRREVA